ncbi:MAG: hypothetical protein LDL53_06670, partial [Candidatus Hydrogenedens sp.]|nr:hypothetical protein [Candidatus Hydrogenedens sp.]
MDEYKFIEHVGKTYTKGSHQDKVIRELIVRTFKPYLNPEMTCLQLGYAEGVDTQILAPLLFQLDVAEANKEFINNGLQHNLKNVRFIHTLFEDLSPEKTGK